MSDLTPQEEAELAVRMQHQATIGVGNPQARRVEVPPEGSLQMYQQAEADSRKDGLNRPTYEQQTPAQRGVMNAQMGGVAGASIGGAPAAFTAPVKSGLTKLGAFLAGLGPEATTAYEAAPRTVEALKGASAARQQQFANAATEATSNKLTNRNDMIEGALQDYIGGKTVPAGDVPSDAMQYLKQGSNPPQGDPVTNKIPAKDLLKSVRQAGEEAKFADNPITPFGDRARAKEAGRAWSGGRQALSSNLPDFDPYMEAKQQTIEAQKNLAPGASMLESGTTPKAAARQNADALVGSTRLDRSAEQLQAAQALQQTPKRLVPRVVKATGVGMMRSAQAVDPLAEYLTRGTSAAGTALSMPQVKPQDPNELTPEEEAELQHRLNR